MQELWSTPLVISQLREDALIGSSLKREISTQRNGAGLLVCITGLENSRIFKNVFSFYRDILYFCKAQITSTKQFNTLFSTHQQIYLLGSFKHYLHSTARTQVWRAYCMLLLTSYLHFIGSFSLLVHLDLPISHVMNSFTFHSLLISENV